MIFCVLFEHCKIIMVSLSVIIKLLKTLSDSPCLLYVRTYIKRRKRLQVYFFLMITSYRLVIRRHLDISHTIQTENQNIQVTSRW